MRTGLLVDALIEHLAGDLGCYVLENSFHAVLEGAVPARAGLRARGGLQLGDRRDGQAGAPGAGAGPLVPGTTVVLRRLRASLPADQPDDRPGRPGTPPEG